MLCNLCQEIHFKPFLGLTREEKISLATYEEWPPEDYDEDELLNDDLDFVGLSGELFYFHHPNLESLRKATDEGCHFCYQILYGLLENAVRDSNVEIDFERM